MLSYLTMGIVLGSSAGIVPGPLQMFIISQAIKHGAKEGIKVAFAPIVSDLPIVLASIFMVSQVMGFRSVLGAITLFGGLFLLYLAYESFRSVGFELEAKQAAPQSLGKGVLINLLNPNPYLFWLTVGAPTILKAWSENYLSVIGFLAGFYTCLVGIAVLMAVLAGKSRHFFAGKRFVYVMRVLGVLLVFFACILFRDGLQMLGLLA